MGPKRSAIRGWIMGHKHGKDFQWATHCSANDDEFRDGLPTFPRRARSGLSVSILDVRLGSLADF